MQKVLIIKAHPKKDSFCNALTDSYIEGLKKRKNDIEVISLRELSLEKFLKYEYREIPELSEEIVKVQKLISSADVLTFSYPTWWATPPALLKVFLEVILQPGFAYKYKEPFWMIPRWDKFLVNKKARIIVTMDSFPWYYNLYIEDPGFKMMNDVLKFCGVKKVKKNYFGSVVMSSKEKREKWLQEVYKIGLKE